jgi:hypothetical protein
MTAMEWLLLLALAVAAVWIVGAVADALIGRTPLTRALRGAQGLAPRLAASVRGRVVAMRLAWLRIDQARSQRSQPARPAYRQEH